MALKDKIEKQVSLRNKKASFDYEFLEQFTAGMVLKGTEIKSIRQSKVSFQDSYCTFLNGELWLKKLHISTYEEGRIANHEPLRDRKLLLKKKELHRLEKKSEEQGLTIIPVSLFINDRGFAKMQVALAKGKKLHDKRDSLKEKDIAREIGLKNR